jgi:hypothetical protein
MLIELFTWPARADNEVSQNNPDSDKSTEADKSAVGAINRPLRLAGCIMRLAAQ